MATSPCSSLCLSGQCVNAQGAMRLHAIIKPLGRHALWATYSTCLHAFLPLFLPIGS